MDLKGVRRIGKENAPVVYLVPTGEHNIFVSEFAGDKTVGKTVTVYRIPESDAQKIEDGDMETLALYVQANDDHPGRFDLVNGGEASLETNDYTTAGCSEDYFEEFTPFQAEQ